MTEHNPALADIHDSFDKIFTAAASPMSPLQIEEAVAADSSSHVIELAADYLEVIDANTRLFQKVDACLVRNFTAKDQLLSEQFVCRKDQPRGQYLAAEDVIALESGRLVRTVPPLAHGANRKLSSTAKLTKQGLLVCNERYAANFAERMRHLAAICIRISS
ncbi:MAG: hypothetical protein QFB87_03980 [Patescibacteria group bacterium]|nr:hypothetical protein [Patescibacteria group bacterium]